MGGSMKRILLLGICALTCAAQELRVYAIDVEGGKATLYVSPSGQSMLLDTGYEGFQNRDADRIVAAAKAAGVAQIDYLVITHYHADHVGGVPQLAAKMPIRNFVDHGKNFETIKDVGEVYGNYVAARAKGNHIVVAAGDRIPVEGIDVEVVTASGKAIGKPLPGGGLPNPLCASYRPIVPDSGENSYSIGLEIAPGQFRLADLGDLYWNREPGVKGGCVGGGTGGTVGGGGVPCFSALALAAVRRYVSQSNVMSATSTASLNQTQIGRAHV